MSRLKLLYFYGTNPYDFNSNLLNRVTLDKLGEETRKKFDQFADEINAEDGHIAIYVSPQHGHQQELHYEVKIEMISPRLREKIHQSGIL
jgi:hypothetical protein